MSKNKTIKYITAPKSLIDSEQISKTVEKKYNDEPRSGPRPVDIKNIKSILVESDTESSNSDDNIEHIVENVKMNKKSLNRVEQIKSSLLKTKKSVPEADQEIIDPSDLISGDEVKKRLENYSQVMGSDIEKLVPGVHLQYCEVIANDNEIKYKYKTGGVLIYNKYPEYITLSNGIQRWSVQLNKNIFFETNIENLKRTYAKIIKEKDQTINALRHSLKLRKEEIKRLKDNKSKK
jgi:hypothetical protein